MTVKSLPPISRRALAYLHSEVATSLLMAFEISGPPPPEALPRIAAQALEQMIALMTRDTARDVRALVRSGSRLIVGLN
jgi:hypothetical protein